ncbi:eCIS core domain-containing protein [Algoriphagus halophilus]|uniref:eCIS core domain-containing protein n=1 Tax=Algoriphagus halophilus TaxID=226505 RepID=A0A1N6EBG5_9BACT|nr:DUF4157 domain-containing protein [Algoriphagus halophilus]SIN80257.1 protein of unknown function [Algoriphagus halophilus]
MSKQALFSKDKPRTANISPQKSPAGLKSQVDNRPESQTQRKVKDMANAHSLPPSFNPTDHASMDTGGNHVIQQKKNNTGLPDHLKSGIESLSGISMDDVQVHRNSDKPKQLQAHAYAQGTDIHLAPGQEQHLPHEAWHVVQQKQGRVKPTMQLKDSVPINDDAGLEKEADKMGAQALEAKFENTSSIQLKAVSHVTQLVNDAGLRPQTDERIDQLKDETVEILKVLSALGNDWEQKYGKIAKEKASGKAESLLKGEETDYPAEIRKAALKELWSRMSTEEKLEMAQEAARLGSNALGSVLSSGWELAKELAFNSEGEPSQEEEVVSSKSRSRQKEKAKARPKPKPSKEEAEKSQGSSGFLLNLTTDDINTLYELYKIRKEALSEIAKAKQQIVDTSGDIGEVLGANVGKLRDEYDFGKRMNSQKQAFLVARKKLDFLKEAINENADMARYKDEIEALEYALNSINGPRSVYIFDLNEEAKQGFPQKCSMAIDYIKISKPLIRDQTISEGLSSIGKALSSVVEGRGKKEEKIGAAKGQLVNTLEGALGKSWSNFTSWGWTPTGIKKMSKELKSADSTDAKLRVAISIAKDASGKESSNRYPETQFFYETLAKVDLNNENSLLIASSVLSQIGGKLG